MSAPVTPDGIVARLREPLVIEHAIPLPVAEVLEQAADERGEAADRIDRLENALEQAANRFEALVIVLEDESPAPAKFADHGGKAARAALQLESDR